MNRATALLSHYSTLTVGLSGIAWGWMRYFEVPDDPFAVVNHPWEPYMSALHILSAPSLIFAAGLIWQNHAWKKIRLDTKIRRKTGLTLTISLLPMIGSGYLLQTATDDVSREIWLWTHLLTSGLWIFAYVTHQLVSRKG